MKHNILKTIIGAMMLSLMFMSFQCGEEEDYWETAEPSSYFALDNHTYDTLDIVMISNSGKFASRTVSIRPFSWGILLQDVKDSAYASTDDILPDFLNNWDTVRMCSNGRVKKTYVGPATDLPAEENDFFNINAWQNNRSDSYRQTKYTFSVRLADFE